MKRKENHKKISPSTPRFTKNNSESDEPMENCRSQQQNKIEARESAGQPIKNEGDTFGVWAGLCVSQ